MYSQMVLEDQIIDIKLEECALNSSGLSLNESCTNCSFGHLINSVLESPKTKQSCMDDYMSYFHFRHMPDSQNHST